MRTRNSAARGESVQSVERAGALLKAIASGDDLGQSGAALATATGMSKPAAYRILRALERIGFVAHNNADGRFSIGIAVREVANGPSWNGVLQRAALADMQRLRERTAETVSLYVPRTAFDIVCVETLASTLSIRYEDGIGRRVSVALGATGTVLLADLARVEGIAAVRALLDGLDSADLPAGGITTVLDRLPHAYDAYCSTIGERVPGSAAISAPIRRAGRRAVAALTISGPVQRFTPATILERRTLLLAAVERIAERLA
jgi:IclR family transcriptional regulator, KDG regulon repressor